MSSFNDKNLTLDDETFRTAKGRASITVKERGERIKMRCRMVDGPTKDNGFLEGTTFFGSVKERGGVTKVKGIVVTAPIYHLIIIALLVVLVVRCISLGAINPVPIILAIFSVFMFKDEYKKQGFIKRYIFKALKTTYMNKHPNGRRGNE